MKKRLDLQFVDTDGKISRFSLEDPKDGLTDGEVKTAMNAIVAANVLVSAKGIAISGIHAAQIVRIEAQELNLK